MLCQSCGQNDANVHLAHVVDDSKREVHLCEECASKNGIKMDNPMSLTDILVGLGDITEADDSGVQKTCALCGLTLAEFRRSSQIGCPACYDTFRVELGRLLSGVHKGDQHIGKAPVGLGAPGENDPKVLALKADLDEAISREEYERAAELRDRILLYKSQRDESREEI